MPKIVFEIHAFDKVTGASVGYMESCDTEERVMFRIEELRQNEKFNNWNYDYEIYQAIK